MNHVLRLTISSMFVGLFIVIGVTLGPVAMLSVLAAVGIFAAPIVVAVVRKRPKAAIESAPKTELDPNAFDPRVNWPLVNQIEAEVGYPLSRHPDECCCSLCATQDPPKFANNSSTYSPYPLSAVVKYNGSDPVSREHIEAIKRVFNNQPLIVEDSMSVTPIKDNAAPETECNCRYCDPDTTAPIMNCLVTGKAAPMLPSPFRDMPALHIYRDANIGSLTRAVLSCKLTEKQYHKLAKRRMPKVNAIHALQDAWNKHYDANIEAAPKSKVISAPKFQIGDTVEANRGVVTLRSSETHGERQREIMLGTTFEVRALSRGKNWFTPTPTGDSVWYLSDHFDKVEPEPVNNFEMTHGLP